MSHNQSVKVLISTLGVVLLSVYSGKSSSAQASTQTPTATSKQTLASEPINTAPTAVITNSQGEIITEITAALQSDIKLYADKSADPNGDRISYRWTLLSKPATSKLPNVLALSRSILNFKIDVAGTYVVRLIISDGKGGKATKNVTVKSVNHPPQSSAKTSFSVFANLPTAISSQNFYDTDKDALSISWNMDSKPQGSIAPITVSAGKDVSFTPDKVGVYTLTAQISDGQATLSQTFNVTALSQKHVAKALQIPEGTVKYSRLLDRLVLLPEYSPTLYLISPYSLKVEAIQLPAALSAGPSEVLTLSPNGRYVYLAYRRPDSSSWTPGKGKNPVSILDLSKKQIIKTLNLKVSPYSAIAMTNQGLLYALEQKGERDMESDEGYVDYRRVLETVDFTKNIDSFINTYPGFSLVDSWLKTNLLYVDSTNHNMINLVGYETSIAPTLRFLKNHIPLDSNNFPQTILNETVSKANPHSINECNQPLRLSNTKKIIFTSSKSYFFAPSMFKLGDFPITTDTKSECISAVAESPVNSEVTIVQLNNRYTIFKYTDPKNMILYGSTTLPSYFTTETITGGTPFYSNDGRLVFKVNTTNNSYLVLK